MAIVIDLAGMTSALGISLASANASARVLYTMGRDRVISHWFAVTHRQFSTPHHATLVLAAMSTVLLCGLGLAVNPYPTGFSYLVAAADVLGLTLYVSINIAWVRMWWKDEQHFQMGWLRGVVPSLLGALVMLVPLLSTVYPIPAWPLNLVLYLTFAYIAVGLWLAWRLKRNHPDLLARAGQAMSAGELPK